MFIKILLSMILFPVIVLFAEGHTKFRDEKWPKSLPADQYAAQVRQNCSELFDKLRKFMKKGELNDQDKEEMKYIEKIFAAMKCTDSELLRLDHEFVSKNKTIPSKQELQNHDRHDKEGWILADRYGSHRRMFCSSILFRPLLISGKKGVKEFAQEVADDSKKLSDSNITEEEKKKIQDKQNLLKVFYDVLHQALGSYDLEAPLTNEEKEKIEQYLSLYVMAKCADRELFRPIRYE